MAFQPEPTQTQLGPSMKRQKLIHPTGTYELSQLTQPATTRHNVVQSPIHPLPLVCVRHIWRFLTVKDLCACLGVNTSVRHICAYRFNELRSIILPENTWNLFRSDGMMRNLLRFCTAGKLKALKFGYLNPAHILALLKQHPQLTSLSFGWHSFDPTLLNAANPMTLKALSVEYWHGERDSEIEQVGRFCNLEALSIQLYDGPTPPVTWLRALARLRVVDLQPTALLRAAIASMHDFSNVYALCVASVPGGLSEQSPSLRELVVYDKIDNNTIKNVCGLPLTHLTFIQAEQMTKAVFEWIIDQNRALVYVGMRCKPDVGVELQNVEYLSGNGSPIKIDLDPQPDFNAICERAGIETGAIE
eukprot:215918_1